MSTPAGGPRRRTKQTVPGSSSSSQERAHRFLRHAPQNCTAHSMTELPEGSARGPPRPIVPLARCCGFIMTSTRPAGVVAIMVYILPTGPLDADRIRHQRHPRPAQYLPCRLHCRRRPGGHPLSWRPRNSAVTPPRGPLLTGRAPEPRSVFPISYSRSPGTAALSERSPNALWTASTGCRLV